MPLPAIIYSDCAIDSISVQADHLNSDMLLTGQTTFSGQIPNVVLKDYLLRSVVLHPRVEAGSARLRLLETCF